MALASACALYASTDTTASASTNTRLARSGVVLPGLVAYGVAITCGFLVCCCDAAGAAVAFAIAAGVGCIVVFLKELTMTDQTTKSSVSSDDDDDDVMCPPWWKL